MSKHTQGKWKADLSSYPDMNHEVLAETAFGLKTICEIENEHDARLIAAAPEMLGLLKEAELIFANGLENESQCVDFWRRVSDVIRKTEGNDGCNAARARSE